MLCAKCPFLSSSPPNRPFLIMRSTRRQRGWWDYNQSRSRLSNSLRALTIIIIMLYRSCGVPLVGGVRGGCGGGDKIVGFDPIVVECATAGVPLNRLCHLVHSPAGSCSNGLYIISGRADGHVIILS